MDAPVAASAALSVVCSVLIVCSYFAFPALRLDPGTSLMWWSAVDGMAAVLFVWQYLAPTESCSAFAFFTQLFMLTSHAFFATFAIDLVHTLRQPFDRVPAWAYFAAAWAVGLSSAVVLNRADVAGVSAFGFCWVRTVEEGAGFNWWLWSLFYIPTSVCFVVAWYAALFGAVRLQRGLTRSFAARERSTRALQLVVHVNFSFFCACGVGYIIDVRYTHGRQPWLTHLVYAAFTGKGAVDLLLWAVVHARSLRARARDGALPGGELGLGGGGGRARAAGLLRARLGLLRAAEAEAEVLSDLLRQEVLEVTLKGIRTGVRRAAHALHGGASLHASDQYAVLGDGLDSFPFFDYRPHAFAALRELGGVSAGGYLASLSAPPLYRAQPGGKSGAFLYTTADSRFLIKTCSAAECATLIRVLDDYGSHLCAQPSSLLCRFYGCHAIEMYSRRVHFLVMANVFGGLPAQPSVTYDLKGSHVGRSTGKGKSSVRLDNDLAHTLWLHPPSARQLASQLRSDASWLSGHGLLDYSLIVGLLNRRFYPAYAPPAHAGGGLDARGAGAREGGGAGTPGPHAGGASRERAKSEACVWGGSGQSARAPHRPPPPADAPNLSRVPAAVVEGPGLFAFGIIDILQTWTLRKRLEYWLKARVLLLDPRGFSAVRPQEYGARFVANVVERLIGGQADATEALLAAQHGAALVSVLRRSSSAAHACPPSSAAAARSGACERGVPLGAAPLSPSGRTPSADSSGADGAGASALWHDALQGAVHEEEAEAAEQAAAEAAARSPRQPRAAAVAAAASAAAAAGAAIAEVQMSMLGTPCAVLEHREAHASLSARRPLWRASPLSGALSQRLRAPSAARGAAEPRGERAAAAEGAAGGAAVASLRGRGSACAPAHEPAGAAPMPPARNPLRVGAAGSDGGAPAERAAAVSPGARSPEPCSVELPADLARHDSVALSPHNPRGGAAHLAVQHVREFEWEQGRRTPGAAQAVGLRAALTGCWSVRRSPCGRDDGPSELSRAPPSSVGRPAAHEEPAGTATGGDNS